MSRSGLAYIRRLPELVPLLERADHIDVKTVSGSVNLRTFLANMLNYQPDWITTLYGVRAVFVRFLNMRQNGLPHRQHLTPEGIPMQEGQSAAFFKVRMAREEHYWVAEIKDKHLKALLGVIVEPLPGQRQKRFHVVTVVHYRNWAGPVYFNVIRPFHHLVVGSMALAGVQ
ncbi:MAG: DUF2867 domain-containing protein [Ktedonobacteraceae bacterium]|nr:DUF2867 domain-containing protein [Ktedonobacteraceae bacterium]